MYWNTFCEVPIGSSLKSLYILSPPCKQALKNGTNWFICSPTLPLREKSKVTSLAALAASSMVKPFLRALINSPIRVEDSTNTLAFSRLSKIALNIVHASLISSPVIWSIDLMRWFLELKKLNSVTPAASNSAFNSGFLSKAHAPRILSTKGLKPFLLLIPAKIVSRRKLRTINDGDIVAPVRSVCAAILATSKHKLAAGRLKPTIGV